MTGYTPKQIDRRVALLAKWREERLAERMADIAKVGITEEAQAALLASAYRQGWQDLAALMALHEQFKPEFGG